MREEEHDTVYCAKNSQTFFSLVFFFFRNEIEAFLDRFLSSSTTQTNNKIPLIVKTHR